MYGVTMLQEGEKGAGRAFSSVAEAIMAHDRGDLHVGAPIKLRLEGVIPPAGYADKVRADGSVILETSLGRALFNEALPADFPFVNERVGKKQIGQIVNDLAERYPLIDTVRTLDGLKDLGFQWGSRSGVTVSIADVQTPPTKPEILAAYDARAAKIDTLYERGSVTEVAGGCWSKTLFRANAVNFTLYSAPTPSPTPPRRNHEHLARQTPHPHHQRIC